VKAGYAVFCLFASNAPSFSPTAELVDTSVRAGLAPLPSPGSGLFIVGGRYCPLLARGLAPPPGVPILLAWLRCGFTTFPIPDWNPPPGLEPGPTPGTAGEAGAWLLLCTAFLVTGFDELWSMPGVFLMDGLSAFGLKSCCAFGMRPLSAVKLDSGISLFTARAEKKATGSEGPGT